jgi:D-alanine transaminase
MTSKEYSLARYAYVDGRYVPHCEGVVGIEDRGFQFADGIYEVASIIGGAMVDGPGHLDRMERSLAALDIAPPVSRRVLELIMRELIARNAVVDGFLYLQITRGVAPRDHKYPTGIRPTLVLSTKRVDFLNQAKLAEGVKAITIPDIRWARCDIKTISLLPNCMGKTRAAAAGAYEALQVDAAGYITEGTSSNAWIVTQDNRLLTRALSSDILRGVTRDRLIGIAAEEGIAVVEEAFSVEAAKAAREAFVTSATSFLTPVVQIDDRVIADGAPGPLSRRLQGWYLDYCAGLRARA